MLIMMPAENNAHHGLMCLMPQLLTHQHDLQDLQHAESAAWLGITSKLQQC